MQPPADSDTVHVVRGRIDGVLCEDGSGIREIKVELLCFSGADTTGAPLLTYRGGMSKNLSQCSGLVYDSSNTFAGNFSAVGLGFVVQ